MCFAVGYYTTGVPQVADTLIEEWDGTTWSVVPSPNPADNENILFGVSCSSPSFCMAVGDQNDVSQPPSESTLIEEWDGSSWAVVPSPNPDTQADALEGGVSCTSEVFCVAVGFTGGGLNNLVEMWDGSAWSTAPTPNVSTANNHILSVSCTSATFCLATGNDLDGTRAMQWDGSSWSLTPSPVADLDGVSCLEPTYCVAGGSHFEEWNGTGWSTMAGNLGGTKVACIAPSACYSLDAYWDGTTWAPIPTAPAPHTAANYYNGISCVPGRCMLAADGRDPGGYDQTFVLTTPADDPGMITVSGTVYKPDGTPYTSGIAIDVVLGICPGCFLGGTTSDSSGNYSLQVPAAAQYQLGIGDVGDLSGTGLSGLLAPFAAEADTTQDVYLPETATLTISDHHGPIPIAGAKYYVGTYTSPLAAPSWWLPYGQFGLPCTTDNTGTCTVPVLFGTVAEISQTFGAGFVPGPTITNSTTTYNVQDAPTASTDLAFNPGAPQALVGKAAKFSVTVSPPLAPSSSTNVGTVQLDELLPDGTVTTLGTSSVRHGSATFQLALLPIGSYPVVALYSTPSGTSGSNWAETTVSVVPIPTTTTLSCPPTPRSARTLLCTIHVHNATANPSHPAGPVSVSMDGNVTTQYSIDARGRVRIDLGHLTIGSHTLDATYAGDATHASSSGSIAFEVT